MPFSVGGQILLDVSVIHGGGAHRPGLAVDRQRDRPDHHRTVFSAGVVVLLYTDRRIRAEAFDLVLQTGAAFGPGAPPDSTDHLWLTRQQA